MKQRRCIRITALLCAVNLLLLCPMASAESLSTEVVDLTVSANESIAALPQNIQSLLSNVKTGDVLVPTDNLYELTLKHADGSYTTEVYSVPVKYTDGEGEVQYIDTSMQSATLLDTLSFNRTYRNQGGYVDLAYKANITDGVVVDDAFTLSVPEQEDQQSAQQATQDDGSGKIVYPQAFGEHTYVEYINTYAGFKENIVLEQNIGQNTFDFVWESDTHIPVLIDDNKAIQIVSKTNPRQVDYTISPLYVYDSFDPTTSDDPYSHKHWTEDCRYDIIDQGDGVYTIRAIVSEEYLNHPETVYPVIIDPTVTADAAASNVEDGFVKESDKAGKYGTYNYLQFGYSGGRIYSYVKFFALPQLPVGAYFTSATFKVTFRTGQNTPADMKATAKTVEGDFDETTLTWNNKPTHKTTLSSVLPKITDGYLDYYNFTVTNGVREWYTNRNYGLVFTYQTETYADYNSVVSSEGDAARAPQLTINYTVPSSQTSGITNDGYYFIRNRSTGQYLTVNGTAVEQSTYDGGSAQLWKMHYYANGGYTLSAVATPNNCLYSAVDNNDGGVYSYLNPTTDADASAADINNSLMMIIPASSGYFRIASRSTGSFWALQADGTTVENYTYTGATNQQWAFEEYSLSLTPQSDWVIAGDMMRINTNNTAGLTLTWTSSNSSLAMVSNGTEYANFYGRSAGTVTVTATAENGDTASCTVEIIANALQTMTQGLSVEGTIAQGGEYWYKFTPATSDTYTFTTTGSTDTRGELYQYLTPLASDDDSGDSLNFSISCALEAGKTYRLKVQGYSANTSGAYTVKVESVFLDNLQALQDLAKAYSNDDETSVELTMQFIRRGKYYDGFWPDTAGDIDETFVEYVENNNLVLHDYFTIDGNYYWQAPNGDIIDIPHLAATFNAYFHDTYSIIGDLLQADEKYVDKLAGWGGDFRSLIPEVMRDVNYTTDYNSIYTTTYQYIGKSGTKFDMNDLLADTDAYNIYNALDANGLKSTFTTYYSTGVATRFTDFTNGWTRDEIFEDTDFLMNSLVVERFSSMKKVDENGKETGEELSMTDSQMNAVCNAYTDYIWERVQAE